LDKEKSKRRTNVDSVDALTWENRRMKPANVMSRVARLWIVFGLNLALIGALVTVGIGAHSLGVLAEGADCLADAAGIGVALFAISLSKKLYSSGERSRYPNATKWAALVNGGWLLILTILVSAGAISRLVNGTQLVHGLPVLIVSVAAALLMLAGALILGGEVDDDDDGDDDLHMKAVMLDTAADAAAAACVAVTGAIIFATNGLYWLDPTVALVVSVVIAYHAIILLRRVVRALRREDPTR
jgi:cobalt-zinc-cadmium efflux system protein